MKKLVLCSSICAIFSVLCLGDNAFAGAFDKIALKLRSSVWDSTSNEYYLSSVENKLIECDNDNGDAGDYVVAIGVLNGGKIKAARQCILTDTGDYWSPRGEIQECKPQSQKKAYWDIPGGGGHKIWRTTDKQFKKLTDGSTIVFDTSSHVRSISDIACIECKKGYSFKNESAGCVQDVVSGDTCDGNEIGLSGRIPLGYPSTSVYSCLQSLKNEGARECTCRCTSGGKWSCNIDQCQDNYDLKSGTSIFNSSGGYNKCVEKGSGGGGGSSCRSSRSTPEGKACCDYPKTIADWIGGQCKCTDTNMKFVVTDEARGKGQCVPKGGCESYKDNPEALACCEAKATWANAECTCQEGTKWSYDKNTKKGSCIADDGNASSGCTYSFNGRVKCANGNFMNITQQKQLTKAELGNLTCEQFNSMYQADVNKLNQFFTNHCAGGAFMTIVTGPSAAEVESAKSTLSAFFSAAQSNASVWKDSEGKFNKARLASDLTAGVVLGSVGGVVSGVVIKKKQVQKGFEALHCAVGGQTIADWGDEFNVGLRR